MKEINPEFQNKPDHPVEMLENALAMLTNVLDSEPTDVVFEIKKRISHLLQNSYAELTAKEIKEVVHFVQKSLRNLGFFLDKKTGQIKKIHEGMPPAQFLFGIGKSLFRDNAFSERTFDVLEDANKRGADENRKIRFVVFDTPQTTNLSCFNGNQFNSEDAYLFSEKRGEHLANGLNHALQEKGLENVEIERFGEIEKQGSYKVLENEIRNIVENDKGLLNQLLNTVSESQLHKSGIGKGQNVEPFQQFEIRRQLAEYALKAVSLHIYFLGDTIVHSNERQNYRLTQTILRNKKYRKRLLSIFNSFDSEITEAHLSSLSEAGFLFEESYKDAY